MSHQARGQRASWGKIAVVVAIAGAVVFGSYIGYLAWTNGSFPAKVKPFEEYATVVSTSFNGTDLSFGIRWLSGDFTPLFAQVSSLSSDAANSPTCWLNLSNATSGQMIPMPFGISKPTPVLTNVELSIAVESVANRSQFTIVHTLESISAMQGNVMPSSFSCQEQAGAF